MKSLLPITLIALAFAGCGLSGGGQSATDGGPHASTGSSSGATSSSSGSSSGHNGSSSGSSSGGSSGSSSGTVLPPDDAAIDPGPFRCKRGVASNAAPTNVLAPTPSAPGVTWWYDWSNQPASGSAAGIEFVPMIWGTGALSGPIPAGSRFLLGFNEPNFANQSDMTPQQAAQNWPAVEALANAQGIPIVAPGLNFCGSPSNASGCSDPSVTDPYTFLRDFLGACPGCKVDYIAVHWYNCDLPSLKAYIDGNATLQGWVQFGKPIWLTEFSCDGSHSAADQEAYMSAAVPYLESNPHVFRYSWFSASPIPSSLLTAADGSLTALGQTYVSLPGSCP